MDTAHSKADEMVAFARCAKSGLGVAPEPVPWNLALELLNELCDAAQVESCQLSHAEFAKILLTVGPRVNFGQATGAAVGAPQQTAFFRSLRLPELALAHACALGREAAWTKFFEQFRGPLTQAAVAIAGSATVGHDLADSLYSELYGLKENDGERRSPLSSYSGRGSLMGWLRTTLAQRFVDHHRRTHRETALETIEEPVAKPMAVAKPLPVLSQAIQRTFRRLAEEDRFLLVSYYLDRRTLQQIGAVLRVHEATISRRLHRVVADVRKQLLRNLEATGMSRRAAEEALGADPRDIELNLRELLQSCQNVTFSAQRRIGDRPR